jgi:MFS family permease
MSERSGPRPARAASRTTGGLLRDKTTWIRYGQLGVVAFLIDGYAPTVSLLAQDLGLSRAQASLHGGAVGLGILLAGSLSARLAGFLGRNAVTWLGLFGMSAAVSLYCLGGNLTLTLLGIGTAGFFGSLVMAAGNADLSALHRSKGPQALNEGAAVSQGFGLLAPAVLGLAAASILGWRAGLMVLVLLTGVLAISGLRSRGGRTAEEVSAEASPTPCTASARRLPPRFWVIWVCLVCLLGIEFSMTMWTPAFLIERTGLDAPLATASVSVTLLGIMLGRFVFARLASAERLDALLMVAILLSLAGFIVFWLATSAAVAVPALFLVGLGISGQYPLSLARMIHSSKNMTDRATASASVGMGLALALAPITLGSLGDRLGIVPAMMLVPLLAVVSAAIVVVAPVSPAFRLRRR